MATPKAPPRNLATPEEIAEYLRIPSGTLANWRSQGTGPSFIHVGRCVRYRWPDVEAWVDAQIRTQNP